MKDLRLKRILTDLRNNFRLKRKLTSEAKAEGFALGVSFTLKHANNADKKTFWSKVEFIYNKLKKI